MPVRDRLETRVSWERSFFAALRPLAACRVLAFPKKLKQLWSLRFMNPYFSGKSRRDPFFFLTHRDYLSRHLSLAQRVDCAIDHYSFERMNSGTDYHHSVYRSPCGLTLWHQELNGVRYTITLRATEDYRHEGDLSVLCFVGARRVCRISFSYVNGRLFDLPPEPAIFVTRNQTDRNPELDLFRATFKQNSPSYFCLAAVCGISMANGMREVLLIKDDAQIAYEEQFAQGFRNSYSGLWQGLGAEEIDGRPAYRLSIPLRLAPISDLRHRHRALARRRNWLQVALSARRAVLNDRKSAVPAPIDGEATSFLPPGH